ncbi:prepilin-type N-terminal cleavage/methylation domain-containing protein [Roseateles violae]|uniref:Prepilin-type N-terminal cleavage/methylation domain-containing protein n=1 Tax=Roseateles violae TaxID=3058042 RepID=A0ABT8DXX1_9BURK|nr:prepilin-type N-terminal cleavage/methylation domain-containing protein [Pelomonas sp. PFR6]MDN3921691.1 prepilin-type N-terminal cleavage/methylation domain-containing protein [Pelomonas sp. PFR6]
MNSFLRKTSQAGFTLIELIIVIVILGILAAVAIPKFTGMSDEAKKGVANGIAAAAASASSTNYALRQNSPPGGVAVTKCDDLAALIDNPDPVLYTIPTAALANGVQGSCTVVITGGATVTFKAYGAT